MLLGIAFHLLSLAPLLGLHFLSFLLFLCPLLSLLATVLSEPPISKSHPAGIPPQLGCDEGFKERTVGESSCQGSQLSRCCFLLRLGPVLCLCTAPFTSARFVSPPVKLLPGDLGNKGTEMKTNYYYCLHLTNAQGLRPLNGNNSFIFSLIKK